MLTFLSRCASPGRSDRGERARLRALGIPFATVVEAVRRSNVETGGRLLEFGGSEYMIRGRGYLNDPRELDEAVVAGGGTSQIVRVKDIGKVTVGPKMRRGVADLDGNGETVSGIVVMRQGANVVDVIDRVKRKLQQIAPCACRLKLAPVSVSPSLVKC